jgi:hypothetical protein
MIFRCKLVIRAAGKIHRFEGGLAIFDWHFVDGGKRVAYSQQTGTLAVRSIGN